MTFFFLEQKRKWQKKIQAENILTQKSQRTFQSIAFLTKDLTNFFTLLGGGGYIFNWIFLITSLYDNNSVGPSLSKELRDKLGFLQVLWIEWVPHCDILAWKTPWAEEVGGLQLMRLQRVGRNWAAKEHNHPHKRHVDVLASSISKYDLIWK